MTKTEYTAAITANQTTISAIRTDLRKLRNIEKLAGAFTDLKLVDSTVLVSTIEAKKAELQKQRAELSKARRIVKRMTEIEDIETGKADEPKTKVKKPAAEKKSSTTAKKSTEKKNDSKDTTAKKQVDKQEAGRVEKPTAITESTGESCRLKSIPGHKERPQCRKIRHWGLCYMFSGIDHQIAPATIPAPPGEVWG